MLFEETVNRKRAVETSILVSDCRRDEEQKFTREFFYRVSLVLDRAFSTLLGRACVLQDEE